jgi:hypothetical protein
MGHVSGEAPYFFCLESEDPRGAQEQMRSYLTRLATKYFLGTFLQLDVLL